MLNGFHIPTDFRQQVSTLDEFWKHKHPAELIAAKNLEKISLLLIHIFIRKASF